MDSSYCLDTGLGLLADLNSTGFLNKIVYSQREYSINEYCSERYKLVATPLFKERVVDVDPGKIFKPKKFEYEFEGLESKRTIDIDSKENQIILTFHGIKKPITGILKGQATKVSANNYEFSTIDPIDSKRDKLLVHFIHDNVTPPTVEIDENGLNYKVYDTTQVVITIEPISIFEEAFIIASTPEIAAVISSTFHKPNVYIPLIFIEEPSISINTLLQIEIQFQATNCEYYIFAGIDKQIVTDFLLDKSNEFRKKCKVFQKDEDILKNLDYDDRDLLRCRHDQIPIGILLARREKKYLVVDESADILQIPQQPEGKVVSYEGLSNSAVVAANFAFYHDAALIDVGRINNETRIRVDSTLLQLQNLVVSNLSIEQIDNHILDFSKMIQDCIQFDLSQVSTLTSFTDGIPYSAGYNIPVGHILNSNSDRLVLTQLCKSQTVLPIDHINFFVATEDFPENEITRALSQIDFFAINLSGEASTKWSTLINMVLIPSDLSVIVAHGDREILYRDKYLVSSPEGEKIFEVTNSSREVPDLSAIDISSEERSKMRRVSRTVIASSIHINGIKMNDAIITEEDIRSITNNLPIRWGLIINNGCATWTSLSTAFLVSGALG